MSVFIKKSNKNKNCYFVNGKCLVIDEHLDLDNCGYDLNCIEAEVVSAIKYYKVCMLQN